MATHTSALPNLERSVTGMRQRRAAMERRISKLMWKMANDENADLARLSETVDELERRAAKLTVRIERHQQAGERKELRRQLLRS